MPGEALAKSQTKAKFDDASPMDPDDTVSSLSAAAENLSPSTRAWREWLTENGPRLILFARQQSRSAEDAEDIVQDALVKLVEKLDAGEFVGGQEAWMPYLFTTIRRLSIDLGRRDDRRRRREDYVGGEADNEQKEAFHPWFESESSDDETRQLLEAGIKELPPKFAEVVVMKVWGDRTFAEIGEALDISPNTAASRYRYGLEALKKKLSSARRKGDLSI
ncbi:sigma-70 family RNA polymerase sigma factor [Haloferula sp. BvORR071]|uniref:RNA polymerase sigma factor n=1 Tax=Haloferula sp. BvORR071 TaxID=1396141 RepID=UPI002240EB27|nr:sigma-70 family RNA polymerase sigma factor [Haloferula sp. BvORR071]